MESVELPLLGEVPADQRLLFRYGPYELVVAVVDGKPYAIDNACPHEGLSLFGGKLNGLYLRCPSHGLKFNLATGCMPGDTGLSVRSYPVTLTDGIWRVALPTELDGTT